MGVLRTCLGFVVLGIIASTWARGQNLLDANPASPAYNNPSFETPDTTFVSIAAPPWELSGPRTIVEIPPFGEVPVVAGCGVFENPATAPEGHLEKADGSQAAYIFANSFPDVVTNQVMDHAFTQVTSLTYQADQQYQLTIALANARQAPPPGSVLTMSLFAVDPQNPGVEQLLASTPITAGQLNGTSLEDFSTITGAVSGSAIGKQIGIRVSTHTDPALPSSTGQFDFDNVRLQLVPEPGAALATWAVASMATLRVRRARARDVHASVR